MKRVFLFSLFWVFCLFSQAQMCVWRNGVLVFETPVSEIDSITFAKTNEAGVATWVLHVPPTTSMSVEISVVGNWGSEGGPEYWVPGAVLMERQEDGSYTLTKEVPAAFQYKYVMRANGGSWSWDNQYDQLYEMPLSLYAEDEILRWDDEFWNYLFYWEFSTSFGEFTTQDVLGSESWMIEFNTASMTGYAENTNNANEDWLISPAIVLPQLPAVKLTLEYIARYFADLANDITVYVSENYSGGSPSTAQWTKIEPASPLVSGADWITFSTTEYSLTPYVGKTIRFAIKYVSTDTKAGTIEIKSVAVEDGEASGSTGVEPEIPAGLTGKGTKAEPYTVNDVIILNSTVVGPFYVKGYIVGQVNGMSINASSVETAAPFTPVEGQTYATNILIANDSNEVDVEKMVPVQLLSGDLRNALNLPENGGMLKKEVLIYGNLERYYGHAGVKSPTYAVVDETEYGSEPVIINPDTQIYAESFEEGQGDFTIVDVLLPAGAQHIWYYNADYKQMAASGYINGASQNAESWLISPALDLSAKTSAIFTFEHAGKQFGAPVTNLTIQVSTTYNGGEINAADWTELTIPDHLTDETNIFKSAGDIDLSEYCGNSNVRVAFKYTSTTSGAGNWFVKNVVVRGDDVNGEVVFEEPPLLPAPGEGKVTIAIRASDACNGLFLSGVKGFYPGTTEGVMQLVEGTETWYQITKNIDDFLTYHLQAFLVPAIGEDLSYEYVWNLDSGVVILSGEATLENDFGTSYLSVKPEANNSVIYVTVESFEDSPCFEDVEYNVSVKIPAMCDSVNMVYIVGEFEGSDWTTAFPMTQNGDTWSATINGHPGTEFKVRGSLLDWSIELQYINESGYWSILNNMKLTDDISPLYDLSGYRWNVCY